MKEETKEKRTDLRDRTYKINDIQGGKSFIYKTRIQDAVTINEAIQSLLMHDKFTVKS
jgi:hypothetical protein